MFAVIKTGGKQYVVKEGDVLSVEKLNIESGQTVLFDQVLLIEDGEQTLIGTPILEKAVVKANVVKNFKADKILVFKKKRRKQYRRTRGHRQPLTEVKIERIYADTTAVPAEELKIEAVKKEVKVALPVAKPEPAAPPRPKPAPVPKAEKEKTTVKKAAKKETKNEATKTDKPKGKTTAKPAVKPKTAAKKTAK